jgi:hypothetical protein
MHAITHDASPLLAGRSINAIERPGFVLMPPGVGGLFVVAGKSVRCTAQGGIAGSARMETRDRHVALVMRSRSQRLPMTTSLQTTMKTGR